MSFAMSYDGRVTMWDLCVCISRSVSSTRLSGGVSSRVLSFATSPEPGLLVPVGSYSLWMDSEIERECGSWNIGVNSKFRFLPLRCSIPNLSLRSPWTHISRTMSLSKGAYDVVRNFTMNRGAVKYMSKEAPKVRDTYTRTQLLILRPSPRMWRFQRERLPRRWSRCFQRRSR